MRSLYRLKLMKDGSFPTILIKNEQKILEQRLLKLDSQDILHISTHFEQFYHDQLVNQEVSDYYLFQSVASEIKSLN